MSWVPLHVHSQFSILDSTASIKALVAKALEYGMGALALTDQGNLHGAVDFYKACKLAKIQPIIGCELYMAPASRGEKKRIAGEKPGYPLVLLAKDATGYQNLCKLSSVAYLEGFYYTPRIDRDLLREHANGLICLSGPMGGKIAQLAAEDQGEALAAELDFFQGLFGEDFYLELNRHHMAPDLMRDDGMERESWLWQASIQFQEKQQQVCERLVAIGKERGIKAVAANDSRYIERGDWLAHEILMNVSSGEPREIWERDAQGNPKKRVLNPKRKVRLSHELYFKSPEEMGERFSDHPEALTESLSIAKKCQFEFDFTSKFYPVFIPSHLAGKSFTKQERENAAEAFLQRLCSDALSQRYDERALAELKLRTPQADPMEVVKSRLAYELDLIASKGLCDYLLIVHDFISWAKKQGIPVGPGRGSGVGSVVCYLIGITDIEPLRFNLFFERFINPERVSYPDIDVDICMERRHEVIEYTIQKYGKDNVAQIITFGTMKAKMAVKDVGRVLSVPLAKVNEIAKLIPEDPNMTLTRALEVDPELRNLYETEEETKRLIDLARVLEGSVRNTGIHAAGLIICADPLSERIPICNSKDSAILVTQYAMKPVEAVGMLKIDFLGLKTLTAIQFAVDAIREAEEASIAWTRLPLDDKATFDLLNQGRTLGVFQLESGGMQDLLKQLHIDKFEEIIAVGALYRPGPMEMIPAFIARKHGREKIEFDHAKMRDILEETYGIMVYQEQVMMMAQRLAGYSLGQGDILRKAMGKKDREEMERQREKFRAGCMENGIEEEMAVAIFDKVEKFASYGFNKCHATAYGYLSYVTAYLKANYPLHWMAALMTSDREDLSKVTKIIRECQAMHIAILPPDVNESAVVFVAAKKGIRFAMTAVKGVGSAVVDAIARERAENGPFTSLYNFVKRIDTQKVGKKVIESLIEAGAFDFTGWGRSQLLSGLEPMYQVAQRDRRDQMRGELTFFSLIEEEEGQFSEPPNDVVPLPKMDLLRREKELLGFYLTGHPLDELQTAMAELSCVSLPRLHQFEEGAVCRIAFVIESVKTKIAPRSNRKFAILTIGEGDTRFELPIWPDLYEEKGYLLVENQLICAVVQMQRDESRGLRLQCRWLDDLTKVSQEMIDACDLAYDRARMQQRLDSNRKKVGGAMAKKQEEMPRKLVVALDAREMHLSHVLQLKEIFKNKGGRSPVELQFRLDGGAVTTLEIDPSHGVDLTPELKAELESLSVVVDISAVKR